MVRFIPALLLLLSVFAAVPAPQSRAAVAHDMLEGRVIRVADGDTITILQDRTQVRIRLVDIDAPEGGQPWGRNSRTMLSQLVAGQNVRVIAYDTDRYGRTVGRVLLPADAAAGTPALDVCREMVRRGGAWAYVARLRDRSKLALQDEASTARRGLWALPPNERIAPWDWRRLQREAQAARRAASTPRAPDLQPQPQPRAASSSS